MKFKIYIIALLIMGILTLGAVSASENSTCEDFSISEIDEEIIDNPSSNSVQINKTPTGIEAENLEMYSRQYKTLDIHLKDDNGNALSNKTLSISINRAKFTRTTDVKGHVGLDIYYIPGNYTADIVFAGDDSYLNASKRINVEVKKIHVLTKFEGNFIMGEDNYLKVTFSNLDTNSKLTNEYVWVILNDKEYYLKTDRDSSLTLPLNLSKGNYTARLSFMDSDSYMIVNDKINFTISGIPTQMAVSMILFENRSGNINFILCDYKNNRLSNKSVLINFNAIKLNMITGENGEINIPFLSDADNRPISIHFEGDEVYEPSNAYGYIMGTGKIETSLSACFRNGELTVSLKDGDDIPLSGREVKITLNGRNYTRTTDGYGQVRLLVNLNGGVYLSSICFNGDDIHSSAQTIVKIKIKKLKTRLTVKSTSFKVKSINKNLKVILNDNKGHRIGHVKLTLKIKAKNYSSFTNHKGVAVFKIKLRKKGTCNAQIRFNGNVNYQSHVKNIKIKIK